MAMLTKFKSKRAAELQSQQYLQCRDKTIPITIIRSRRRRRKLSLQVGPAGVVLRAPFTTRAVDIEDMLHRHRDWIYERQHWHCLQRASAPCYEHGQRHDFMGEPLVLAIAVNPRRAVVTMAEGILHISGSAETSTKVKEALQRWYLQQAKVIFGEKLSFWAARLPWVEDVPQLRLRRMRSRWGSCSADGRICLNTHLIKAKQCCIDYVIVHELCHLQEFNHSPRFYALMAEAMPEWQQHKAELESVGSQLVLE